MSDIRFSADDSLGEWSNVIRVIGRENRRLPKRFQQLILAEAKKAAKVAQARALAIPTEGDEHTGLRKRVAGGVHLAPFSSVGGDGSGVNAMTSMPEADESYIPIGLDTRKGWQHPLFGDKERWFRNRNPSGQSWFREVFADTQMPIALGIHEAIEEAMDEIDNAAKRTS